MSDALTYLLKARPEAMEHYFAFLKDAGKHLDPKTRNLISVITKVHAQTERGLRQYLGRALREGCSATEVIDALLMAFPALGLAKIVWAIDVILAMQLPEFEQLVSGGKGGAAAASAPPSTAAPEADAGSAAATRNEARSARRPRWHDLMAADALRVGAVARIERDGRGLFVYRAAGGYRVYDSLCPHQVTNIPDLALVGMTLTCPKHEWAFDIRTGECIAKGDEPLRQWRSQLREGRLLARW